MERYDHAKVEEKWQKRWVESQLYKTTEDSNKPKSYVLDMFPYPSGEGLHVGHPKGYIATDIYSRFKRMQGHNVLHPMGWDAFGLPAENYALKNKVHPRVAVEKNIATFKEQLSGIGFNYDWSREINTTDPAFYKWTQWIFLQLFKKGLAYQSNEPINWCPSCMTGLANEDLDGTVCERCGSVVEKRALPQWVLKITAYADRMLTDLDGLQWPEHIKTAQRNWIGRSEGSEIDFTLTGTDKAVKVFTTRADTLFGATFLVLAPEHTLVQDLLPQLENKEEASAYIAAAAAKTEIERTNAEKEKTGVELKGIKAINPINKEEIPVFIADYVLAGYGTGAIMAVPAHDERDFAFAKKYNVPIREVISAKFVGEGESAEKDGIETLHRKVVDPILHDKEGNYYLVKEGSHIHFAGGGIDGEETDAEALRREIAEETGFTNFTIGKKIVPPITVWGYRHTKNKNSRSIGYAYEVTLNSSERVHSEVEDGLHELIKVPKDEVLKTITWPHHRFLFEQYLNEKPFGDDGVLMNSGQYDGLTSEEARKKITEAVGGKITSTYKIKDWVFSRQRYWGEPIPIIHCPKDGAVAVPEDQLPVLLPEVESYEPSGTGESPLANITEWVNTTCPTCGGPGKRETNTMPQWAGSSWYYLRFMDPSNSEALVSKDLEKHWAPVDVYVGGDHAVRHLIYARFWHKFLYDIGAVSTIEPFARLEFLGFILAEDGRKMSKRYGNVINPTDVVKTYGADAFRTYEMFMGPFENTVAWSTASITGTARFIDRIWRISEKVSPGTNLNLSEALLHQTIKKVTTDIESFKFNTAVSQLMILLNAIEAGGIDAKQWDVFLRLLAPFCPHVTEELWERLGNKESIHIASWPTYDESKLVENMVTVAVQINGKTRATVKISKDASKDEVLSMANAHPDIASRIGEGKEMKVVYVPGKIINFVVS